MTSASNAPVGVYVHFPYCRKRCPYCDFDIHVRKRLRHEELARAVLAELDERAPWFAGRRLVSIYFGGGTPSLWEPASVAQVIAAIRADPRFLVGGAGESPIEITLEANPDDLPRATLVALHAAGVNRISLGAQSLSPERLSQLGRLHGPEEISAAVEGARAAGFENLSLDLIFGLPEQDRAEIDREVVALLALSPDHISAYQLTIEDRTPFGAYVRRGALTALDPAREAELYTHVEDRLAAAGFSHYEVSSHARPQRRALHNSLYWSGGEWLGLGPSAHSFRLFEGAHGAGGERWSNPRNVDRYIARWLAAARPSLPLLSGAESREPLSLAELEREAMWLGLRQLVDGVDRTRFTTRFGADPVERFSRQLAPLVGGGLIEIDDARLRLTRRGALLCDEVGLRFL